MADLVSVRLVSCMAALAVCSSGGLPAGSRFRQFPKAEGHYLFRYENVLGSTLEMRFYAPTEEDAFRAGAAARSEIDREAAILSAWDSASEFSLWAHTRGRPVKVSSELFEVLHLFDVWRIRTDGALDAAAEVVGQVWKRAEKEQQLPSAPELRAAVRSVRLHHWTLDEQNRTATRTSDVPVALNSFAKSYIVGLAADAAMACCKITSAVINVGGDLVVRGPDAETVDVKDPFSLADNDPPVDTIVVRNRAVATSGSYRRGFDIGGKHYSHIVDPRTGETADKIVSATVVAADPSDAGALATAFCVLAPTQSRRLAATVPGAEFLLITDTGVRIASAGWASLRPSPLRSDPSLAFLPAAASEGNLWDPAFSLTITVEIRTALHVTHDPYLAVWVENQSEFPVRVLALWFDHSQGQYLSELSAFSRGERRRQEQEGSFPASVSGATRPPGKYTLVWNGKDNGGRAVKAGTYTVYVESAKEPGAHFMLRQAIDFTGAAKKIELQGQGDIASVTLDYHKN